MKNIYIGNLDPKTSEDQLRTLFAAHGAVEAVNVVKDRDTGQPRGFAFLEMSQDSEAEKAILTLNGTLVEGHALTVNEARPRPAGKGRDSSDQRGRHFKQS